jgi:hypothetical protein
MTRALRIALLAAILALPFGCATEGAGTVGFGYSGYYGDWWDDPWYWGGGCCVDYPDFIGPPHPEHPIVIPPGSASNPKPSQPIATPPTRPTQLPSASQRPMATPMPRPAMRGGGGRR